MSDEPSKFLETIEKIITAPMDVLFMFLGIILFIISLFSDIKVLSNNQVAFLSGFFFCIGLGLKLNLSLVSKISPPNIYTGGQAIFYNERNWTPNIFGWTLILIGFGFLFFFIRSFF